MSNSGYNMAKEVSSVIKDRHKPSEKICFICETEKAEFCIKGAPEDCYCKDCAIDAFGETDCLEKM